MAPLVKNLTTRWYLDYAFPGGQHTVQFRTPAAVDDAEAVGAIGAFADAVKDTAFTSWSTTRLRKCAAGNVLSFPVNFVNRVGTLSGNYLVMNYPRFVSWTGRSTDGRRCRITVFGMDVNVSDDYRLEAGEIGSLADVITLLQAPTNPFCSASGVDVTWNPYVNVGYNAYFQRRARRVL